jgi:hypothetical protein
MSDRSTIPQAAESLRELRSAPPDDVVTALKLGKALLNQRNPAGAIEILAPIAHQHPHLPEVAGSLANAYMLVGDFTNAAAAFSRAIAAAPNLAVAHFGLGSAMASQHKIPQAIAAFRAALRLNYPAAHCNLGVALVMTGAFDEAASELQQAIALNPNDAVAHWNHALLKLLRGDWPAAWPEYEWRWRWNQFPSLRRDFKQPMWRGQDLHGQTLLLHAEQGFGDTIQLIRFLPLVKNRGAKIIVECQAEFLPLFQQLPGDLHWLRAGDELPPFDLHCPLASLPLIFSTTLQTIPQQSPPLVAPADRVAHWRQRMGATDRRLRVGICWAGNSTFNGDHTRSVCLEQLRTILETPGIEFYSLQKGSPAVRIRQMGLDERLTDLGSDFRDFADTAAAISLCDLIITTDTSVPHLAGAMGKAVWVMLQFVPDWRWLLDRQDSPWYPSARLFRQAALGDWDGVISRVAKALTNM